jgi:predicted metal-binding protein
MEDNVNIILIGCSAYMGTSNGCPGEWRCLTAAVKKDESFKNYEDPKIVGFVRCECPGRATVPNVELVLQKVHGDVIHLSKCLVKASPPCPYFTPEDLAKLLKDKTGLDVVLGTHNYPL